MPRINRKIRVRPQNRVTRAQILELLLGPNSESVFASGVEAGVLWADVQKKLSPEFAEQWFVARGKGRPFAEIAFQYALDVTEDRIPACQWTRLACQRYLDDLNNGQRDWPYRFDIAKAERACRFIELLPHVKGIWAAKLERLKLEPWQVFIVCSLFGWVWALDGRRRFTLAYIEVSRKNGKSILAAAIGIYLAFCDGEFGAEVYSGATTEAQAHEVFRPARQMMERSPELSRILGLRTPPASKQLSMPENGSRFEPVVGKPGDGASPHCGIVDEYHEHDSDALVDTFRTGMGARSQPILFIITTAGDNAAGPCKLLQGDVCKILQGTISRDEVFGIIYSIDNLQEWASEKALAMANPNLGVSVSREFLLTEQRAALTNPRKQGVFQTKNLCVWVGAVSAYFDAHTWTKLGDRSLSPDSLIGSVCVTSVDLSTKRDFTVRISIFKKAIKGKDHYYLFSKCYLPQAQIEKPEHMHYKDWAAAGFITVHSGSTVDFEEIENETIADVKRFRSCEFAFDPWNAAQFAQGIAKKTKAEIVEIQQSTKNHSPAMKELDALIADGRIHHDGNPVIAWMIGNVMAKEDKNENVFPCKEDGREENKIDGAVATLMALSRAQVAIGKPRSIYATRGVLTVPASPGMGMYA